MTKAIALASPPPRRFRVRRCSFQFDGRPQSVKAARDWLDVRMNVADVPEETADAARLLLSELATNALIHTTSSHDGGAFYVRAYFFPGRLRVEVRDAGGAPPSFRVAAPDPDAECGRGLLLVNALADRWGRFESGRGPGMFLELRWDRPGRVGAGALARAHARERPVTAVPGYNLWPSDEPRQLRADFPDYLICEIHDEHGRPLLIATRTLPAVPGADDVVRAPDAGALRNHLSRQPTARPLPHLPRQRGER